MSLIGELATNGTADDGAAMDAMAMDAMAKRLSSPPYEKACPARCDVGDVAIGALVLCFVLTLVMSTFGSPWRRPSSLPASPYYPTFFALGFVGDVRDLKPTGRRGGGVLQ